MLAETLAEAARRFGDRLAVVADPGPGRPAAEGWGLTYAQLDALASQVAGGLARRGVGRGDVVSLVLPAVPEHLVAYLAAARLGAVTAAVNARLAPVERDAVLAAACPVLLLATEDLAPARLPGGADLIEVHPADAADGPEGVLAGLRSAGGAAPVAAGPDPERPVAIVFTSGTTGLPKGAVFGGRQLAFITRCDVGPEWGGGGPVLAGPALAHLGPTTKLAGNLQRGATLHLVKAWHTADALRRIAELRIAGIGGVPTQLALMLGDAELDRHDFSCVRAIVIGGGPATPALIRQARERFGVPVSTRYSCTEAGIGTATGFADPAQDAEVSVGRPQPGVRLVLLGDDGAPVAQGQVGEVCLGSPAVMDGYWNDPDASAAAFAPGGEVRTGDLGWIDDVGRLRLSGRARERYVRGGYNVYPMEVEAVLADHPGVAALAVVGRGDPVMGEVGVVVVVPADPASPPDLGALRAFAADRLARYKLPDHLVAVDALPLTAMDKVDRRALERLVEAGL